MAVAEREREREREREMHREKLVHNTVYSGKKIGKVRIPLLHFYIYTKQESPYSLCVISVWREMKHTLR